MLHFIYALLQSFGLHGWQLNAISSFCFVAGFLAIVPIIGSIVRKFAVFQINCLSKLVGVRFAEFICNRLLFLGTVVHELSHALFAAMSGAKVLKVRCLTLFSKDTLGYVQFATRGRPVKRSFQMAFIGCAPTVVGCLLLYIMIRNWNQIAASFPVELFLIYFGVSVADHMSMSSSDVQNYIKGCPLIFVLMFVLAMGFCKFCMI